MAKIKAVGHTGTHIIGNKGIDVVLAHRRASTTQNIGYGRMVTTVGDLPAIHERLAEGYEILWCQMCKMVPGKHKERASD